MIEYSVYTFTKQEWLLNITKALGITTVLAYSFYKSIIAVFVFAPFSILILKILKENYRKKRLNQLGLEFREGIQSLSAALNAGYSIENAFDEAVIDLLLIYDENSYIVQEFRQISNRVKLSYTVEEALYEFADRANLEDIRNFAEVFSTAKRTGGDIIKIIGVTSKNIGDKIEVRREIETMITAKKFESIIMNLMPVGIIAYMWLTSPGYLDPLYYNLVGISIMTVLLAVYIFGFFLTQKMMDIHV